MDGNENNKKLETPDETVVVDPKAVEQILAEPVEEEKEPDTKPDEAVGTEAESSEPEQTEEPTPEIEAVKAEEAEPEKTEPEEAEEAEPEKTEPEEPEVTGETVVLTEKMKEALAEQEEEEVVDAKIRSGLNEAAEEFKVAQEIDNTGEDIASEIKQDIPVYGNQPTYRYQKKEDARTMNENMERETAEVKTVYIKEKQKTGWWKIVMLVLTIIIAVTFAATALFAGIGVWQLNRIAENKEQTQIQLPGDDGYDYYWGDSEDGYGNYYGNGQSNPYSGSHNGNSYGSEDDINLDDIFEYFYGQDSSTGGNGNTVEDFYSDYGDSHDVSVDDEDGWGAFSDWLSELFGGSDSTTTAPNGTNQQF